MVLNHIISTKQFLKRSLLEEIFTIADEFQRKIGSASISKLLNNNILATVFYEPSTRTRFSFEAAMLKLGGQVISTEAAGQFSSAIKGETLQDTIRIVACYADIIALRHPHVGAATQAARVSPIPIINAGDGAGEHPTQALLDLYTIKKELGTIDNITVALVGDLLYGRTIHSLVHLFSVCKGVTIFLVSPRQLKLPTPYKSFLTSHGLSFLEIDTLDPVLSKIDVIYVTRIQKERFASVQRCNNVKNAFTINKHTLISLHKKAIIMHPLPRVNEIAQEVDSDPRAAYFRQAGNGLYIRMALLALLLKKI